MGRFRDALVRWGFVKPTQQATKQDYLSAPCACDHSLYSHGDRGHPHGGARQVGTKNRLPCYAKKNGFFCRCSDFADIP